MSNGRRLGINTNRLAIKSRFLYGLSGGDEVTELEERIQNCVVLENDRIESRLAAQELECWGLCSAGALVGEFSYAGLCIPANRGVVVTITHMAVNLPIAPATSWLWSRQYGGSETAGGSAIARDSRAGSSRVPACILVQDTDPGTLGTNAWSQVPAETIYRGAEIVIAGSETGNVVIWIHTATPNTACQASFAWRERILEGGFLS